METNADRFHAHLERCEQCRRKPFALCRTGARLLAAVEQDGDALLGAVPQGDGADAPQPGDPRR